MTTCDIVILKKLRSFRSSFRSFHPDVMNVSLLYVIINYLLVNLIYSTDVLDDHL